MKKIIFLNPDDLKYISGLKRFIIGSFLLFLSAGIYGFLFVELHPESAKNLLETFRELSEKIAGLSHHELMLLIFLNNSFKIAILIILGILLGLAPIIFLTINGFLLGVVAFITQSEHGITTLLIGILPHGIFEIPVLIVGGSIGLKLGKVFVNSMLNKQKLLPEVKSALSFFARILLPLLLFAAFIEVFITKNFILLIL